MSTWDTEVLEVAAGDAGAVVLDHEDDAVVAGERAGAHRDVSALFAHRFAGVLDQVDQHLPDLRSIDLDLGEVALDVRIDLDLLPAERRPHQLDRLGKEPREAGAGQAKRRRAPRVEQALKDPVHAPELAQHLIVKVRRGAVGGLVLQHLQRPLYPRQRVLDLVRQAGGELAKRGELVDVSESRHDFDLARALAPQKVAHAPVKRRGRRIERHLRSGIRRAAAGGGVVELGLQPGKRSPHRALHH